LSNTVSSSDQGVVLAKGTLTAKQAASLEDLDFVVVV